MKAFTLKTCMLLNAKDMVRLPKYALVERLAVVQSQTTKWQCHLDYDHKPAYGEWTDHPNQEAASSPSQSYFEVLKTMTDGQQKKQTVKMPHTITKQSRKHRANKDYSGLIEQVSWHTLPAKDETGTRSVSGDSSQTTQQSSIHPDDDISTRGRIGVDSTLDDASNPYQIPRYIQEKINKRLNQKTVTGTATSSDTGMANQWETCSCHNLLKTSNRNTYNIT